MNIPILKLKGNKLCQRDLLKIYTSKLNSQFQLKLHLLAFISLHGKPILPTYQSKILESMLTSFHNIVNRSCWHDLQIQSGTSTCIVFTATIMV